MDEELAKAAHTRGGCWKRKMCPKKGNCLHSHPPMIWVYEIHRAVASLGRGSSRSAHRLLVQCHNHQVWPGIISSGTVQVDNVLLNRGGQVTLQELWKLHRHCKTDWLWKSGQHGCRGDNVFCLKNVQNRGRFLGERYTPKMSATLPRYFVFYFILFPGLYLKLYIQASTN